LRDIRRRFGRVALCSKVVTHEPPGLPGIVDNLEHWLGATLRR
jgi:hypothetical protein